MNRLKIAADSEPVMIELPGLQAVVIDPRRGIVAVDAVSGSPNLPERIEWRVFDLRDGTYGDFHRLTPAAQCIDGDCVKRGEHVCEPAASERESGAMTGYEDQAAEFITATERYAALGLPTLPDDPAAAAAMRAEGYDVLAEVTGTDKAFAIVHVLSEDEGVEHVTPAADVAAALGVTVQALTGRQFLAILRETPETGPVLSGFRPVPEVAGL